MRGMCYCKESLCPLIASLSCFMTTVIFGLCYSRGVTHCLFVLAVVTAEIVRDRKAALAVRISGHK